MADDKSPTIDADAFFRRLGRVQAAWKAGDADPEASLEAVDGLLLVAGGLDEDNPYKKTTAFQTWLLGYEFPSCLMLVSANKVSFLAGASRTKIVEPLKKRAAEKDIELQVLTRGKDAAANEALWNLIFEQMSGRTIGVFAKDKFTGKFVDEWEAYLSGQHQGRTRKELFTVTDVAPTAAAITAVKEEDEIMAQTMGAKATMRMLELFTTEMGNVLENEQSIKHEKLSEKIESLLEVPKTWKNFKPVPGVQFDPSLPDWCYTPIIQSGGNFDLKPSAQSDDQRLRPGVVLCSMGVRYKSYCANVGRTFLIDPDKTQKDNFAFLVVLHQFVLEQMKDGTLFSDVYQATVTKIQNERPDLMQHFSKSMGFLMGIEFKEPSFSLNHKCAKLLKKNMILSLNLGFQGIADPKKAGKTYALQMVDTVSIGANSADVLADGLKTADEVMFSFDDGRQDAKAQTNGKAASSKRSAARTTGQTAITKSKLRQKDRAADEQVEARKQHQKMLHEKRQEEGMAKYKDVGGESLIAEKQWKRFESYARETQLPDAVKNQQIVVDNRRQTFILPINGFAVPFHIKTLRSVVKQEEGEWTTLRFMFIAPGQIQGKKEDTPFEDPNANFIRALSYRSQDNIRFSDVAKQISDLKRDSTKREQERQQMADLVDQDRLVEGRRARLHDTWLRPAFEGKRSTGDVEIHSNGIRWASKARTEHKCDILFSNIKHLFFQPCDNELVVLIHVHLRTPIMVGKKKVKDIQFYREASESSFDETGNRKRRRQHEDDELKMEQEERRQRAALNKEFRQFADRISDASSGRFEVDIPFRELGFGGVPFRSSVTLMPTTDCLVHLSDPPFLVITLEDIELAHLERIQYGLRNFDLVFVFKEFTRTPVHINTIPSEDLENVKDWLNSVDIPTSEGPVNLNWGAIMKQVNEDPYEFFNEGGWGFLSADSDAEGGGSDDESEAESNFEPEAEELQDGTESGSDFSDDASASADSDASEPEESEAGSYGEEEED